MGEILKALLLGVIEGFTEFLPISSTGHLIIAEHFLKLRGSKSFVTTFEVVIQLGAILSVVVLYFKDLWPFGTHSQKNQVWHTWLLVLIATIPAFVLGFLFDDWIEKYLFSPFVVSLTLILYGVILLFAEDWGEKHFKERITLELFSVWKALGIGFFQCLALIPGTSRSLATILGGLLLGLSRESAARFSFFLAIPIMMGASGLKLLKHGGTFSLFEFTLLGIGFLASFVIAYLAVRGLMHYIQRHDFKVFGYYRILLGGIVLILVGKGVM